MDEKDILEKLVREDPHCNTHCEVNDVPSCHAECGYADMLLRAGKHVAERHDRMVKRLSGFFLPHKDMAEVSGFANLHGDNLALFVGILTYVSKSGSNVAKDAAQILKKWFPGVRP